MSVQFPSSSYRPGKPIRSSVVSTPVKVDTSESKETKPEASVDDAIASIVASYRSNDGLGKAAIAKSRLASAEEALKTGVSPDAYMVVKPYVEQMIDQMRATC